MSCEKCQKYEKFINAWIERFTEIMIEYGEISVTNPLDMDDFKNTIYFELQTFVGWNID